MALLTAGTAPLHDRRWVRVAGAVGVSLLPIACVRLWMATTFPSYLHGQFEQDLVFALAGCGLLVAAARWRLLHVASVLVAVVAPLRLSSQ